MLTQAVYAAEDAVQHLPIHWMWWPAIGGLVIGVGGQGFAIQRAQCAERPTRVLSVAMPVLAYIAGWGV